MPKQPAMSIKAAVDTILAAGLSVIEHENKSANKAGNNHLTIVGGKRHVDFWNTTLTFYANGVKGEMKASRGKGIAEAIRVAKEGR